LVGETVGARLIAHAGSLINLAKHPASTVQILGAEKALFRALKAKKPTPKYGLIYHAALVNQASVKNKGKISRILANKASLSCRVDALGDENTRQIGVESLEKVTSRLKSVDTVRAVPKSKKQIAKYKGKGSTVEDFQAEDEIQLNDTMDTKDDEEEEMEEAEGEEEGEEEEGEGEEGEGEEEEGEGGEGEEEEGEADEGEEDEGSDDNGDMQVVPEVKPKKPFIRKDTPRKAPQEAKQKRKRSQSIGTESEKKKIKKQ